MFVNQIIFYVIENVLLMFLPLLVITLRIYFLSFSSLLFVRIKICNSNLKIASLNVRGLADRKKRLDIFEWLKSKQCAIYCLQDIHINSVSEGLFRNDWWRMHTKLLFLCE